MSIEEIVRAWKSEEDGNSTPTNPVGEELTEEELQEVSGGMPCCPALSCNTTWQCFPFMTVIE
ncbi:MAG: bacteriocin [Ktedonobacteraceae bacterium]|nr:bacteriocin [Ktedonobacteraceae bacterium]MBO0790484.1 bacteriocin [Ktedonobacteraceae bacterium]